MKVDLSGKVALVTGAARGIGQAIADTFVANGALVFYTDIDMPALKETAARSPNGRPLEMDVTNEPQVNNVVDAIVAEYGHLDIVVNNAGVNTIKHRVTMEKFPTEEWRRLIEVDMNGVFIVGKAAGRVMAKQKSGRIINVSSIGGLIAVRLQCAYIAAKHAVVGLTRTMALELAPYGILVNAIAPGSTLTQATEKLFYGDDGQFRESMQRLLDHIPLGRPGTTQEMAHAALFLAAPESSYVTGIVLPVDGGWTAGGYARDF